MYILVSKPIIIRVEHQERASTIKETICKGQKIYLALYYEASVPAQTII
jgi:hypothetical protein